MGDFGEWHVGDPIGFGNDTGAPEVPYMSYGPKREEEENDQEHDAQKDERFRRMKVSKTLADEAWRLYGEERLNEAMILIDLAIENNSSLNKWNMKAIMMEHMGRFDEALDCYDEALDIDSSEEVVLHNKAVCLKNYAWKLYNNQQTQGAFRKLMMAIEIFSRIKDKSDSDDAWDLKARIALDEEDYTEAFECYKHALEFLGDDEGLRKEYKRKRDDLIKHLHGDYLICPECGNSVLVTDSFCIKCGAHIDSRKFHHRDGKILIKHPSETDVMFRDEDI